MQRMGHVAPLHTILTANQSMIYHRVCNKCKTTGDTSGAGTVYQPGAPEFAPGF
jgi:hypothetical protein